MHSFGLVARKHELVPAWDCLNIVFLTFSVLVQGVGVFCLDMCVMGPVSR